MSKLFISLFTLLFFTTDGFCMNSKIEYQTPPGILMAAKIEKKVAREISKKHKLDLIATGGGMFGGIINMVHLSFETEKLLTVEKARELLIDCVDTYVNAINSKEEIRPYLKNFPFTSKNIDIAIYSQPKKGNSFHPYLRVAANEDGNLVYRTKDPHVKFGYKSEIFEPYKEALQIVKNKQ